MDDLERLLEAGDTFSRINHYELRRGDGRVFVFVHEVIAGKGKGRHVAYPS